MAYSVTFTLNALYTGTTQADDFTIIGQHSNGSPGDTTISTAVTKAQLTAGVTYQVADTITGGTVTSTGVCTNQVPWTGLGATSSPSVFYRFERCTDNAIYHARKDAYCLGGNITLTTLTYSVDDVIQFVDNGTGCDGSTYCATITDVNFSANAGTQTAYVSRLTPMDGCDDTIHCQ